MVAGTLLLNRMVPGIIPKLLGGVTGGATRSLNFPSDRPVGSLSLVSQEGQFKAKPFGVARGPVTVPADAVVMLLDVPRKDAYDLDFLTKLGPEDLQYLYIHDEPISDKGLQAIGTIKGLHSINLERCTFNDAGFKDIELPALGGLDLHDTSITDNGVALLSSSLRKVSWLDLKGTKVTSKGCANLRNWQLLHTVDLSNTRIDDQGLTTLTSLPQLRKLDLSGTPITDGAVNTLASIKSLKQVNLASTNLSGGAIKRLKAALPECQLNFNR
jgi:uncharacterized protein YjbI with pentapeptide repeats